MRDDGGVLSLADFEGAAFRHIAWDVAYLTGPWPSCWCCWRIPHHLSYQALDRATVGWAVISAGWFLDRALNGDPPPG